MTDKEKHVREVILPAVAERYGVSQGGILYCWSDDRCVWARRVAIWLSLMMRGGCEYQDISRLFATTGEGIAVCWNKVERDRAFYPEVRMMLDDFRQELDTPELPRLRLDAVADARREIWSQGAAS
ncbi:MAG: hypothetical protein F4103_13015 [Boseongicola sp. SB0673_bin_14]|nr:hypothetical protein [Boseongicola sp. SB0673_bin_14]